MKEAVSEKDYPIENLWIVKSALYSLAPFLILLFLFTSNPRNSNLGFYFVVLAIFTPLSVVALILRKANFHYSTEAKFFNLRQGILNKQQRHIPYGVIQNTFVKQGVLDRVFGLATLTIENAAGGAGSQDAGPQGILGYLFSSRSRSRGDRVGFSGNKVSIPGLKRKNAEALKKAILQKMEQNPIADTGSGL